jgi:O-antigen/teichoic acid export membrane protein
MPSYAIANGSTAVGGFLGLALFTRWLSPAEYGIYSLILTTATLVDSVLFSCIYNAMLRYLPEHERRGSEKPFLSSSLLMAIMFLVPTMLIWVAAVFALGGPSTTTGRAAATGLVVLVARVNYSFVLALVRARRQRTRYALYNAISGFGIMIVALLLRAAMDTRISAILIASASAMAIPAAIEMFRCRVPLWFRSGRPTWVMVRKSLSYGVPLVGASLGALILSVADRYMLQLVRGSAEVGSYSAGYDLADKTLKLLFTVLVASSFPVVMEVVSRKGHTDGYVLINGLLKIYAVWMIPFTVLMIGLRREIVQVALGSKFVGATGILPWIALGSLCWGAGQVITQAFQVEERTAPLLYCLLAAGGFNVALNLWLIRQYGAVGAAISTTAAYFCYLLLLWGWAQPIRRLFEPITLYGPVVAGIAMYFAMRTTPSTNWGAPGAALRGFIGLGTYGLTIAIFARKLFVDNWRNLRSVLNRGL